MKRMLIISDTHCGHRFGLTPPKYWLNEQDGFLGKAAQFQRKLWEWFSGTVKQYSPIDILISNGDAIDGKGELSGSTELLTADRVIQVEMARDAILFVEAKKNIVVNGTPYHTGKLENFEAILASELNAEYGNHIFLDCEGVIFDIKHKTSSSVIPHGRFTGPRRAVLWNSLQAEIGIQPKADFLIRSHTHYYTLSEDERTTVITTPALEGWTKFGSLECEGTNTIGILFFDCDNGEAELTKCFFDMTTFKADVLKC